MRVQTNSLEACPNGRETWHDLDHLRTHDLAVKIRQQLCKMQYSKLCQCNGVTVTVLVKYVNNSTKVDNAATDKAAHV